MRHAPASGGRVRRTRQLALCRRVLRHTHKGIVLVGFALLVIVGFVSCSKSSGQSPSISVDHDISPKPIRVGPATITLRLTDVAGMPVTRARIAIEGDMSHPGMSPVFGQAEEFEAGRYQGQIGFAMAGDWVLLFHITLSDDRTLDRQVSVPAVRAN
jgi:YtkA-like